LREDLSPHQHPWSFRLYYVAVLVAAAVLLAAAASFAPQVPAWTLALVLVLMVAIEATPVPLPSGGYANASAVLDLPALVILGPFYTAILDMASALVAQGFILRKPAVRVTHNLAIFAITDVAAGYAYIAAGGIPGRFDLMHDVIPLLIAGGVYFAANSALVSTVVGLTAGPNPWRVWQRNFYQGISHHLSFVVLGILAALTYFGVGAFGLVLFAIPFLVARHTFLHSMEIRSDLKDFVRALSEVLEEVDPYTRHHSVRVAQYAIRLARGMRLSEREVEEIEYAALVHDLGKIGPQHQHILRKPGTLSHEEQRTLRAHPAAGAEIVAKVRALRRSSEIVRSHHERPDGQGYPYGLRSQDVPVGARILNVSDAFDAMTSDRPYRRALSLEAALKELRRGAGSQFDAEVVACLVRLQEHGQFPLLPSPSSEDLLHLRLKPLRARM
jgi:putative nucleotidyltransferase with HDIG domain